MPCKIGISVCPSKRLTQLQTSHWRELQISEYRWVETVADAGKIEKEAHNILRSNGKALMGEWFDVRPSEALQAVEWAALTVGANLHTDPPNDTIRRNLERMAYVVASNRNEVVREGSWAFRGVFENCSEPVDKGVASVAICKTNQIP